MNSEEPQDIELGWDSLLDTMTNVVGVLIVVLAVVYLGVRGAVTRIEKLSPVPSTTQRERASTLSREHQEMALRLQTAQERWRQASSRLAALHAREGQLATQLSSERVPKPVLVPTLAAAELESRNSVLSSEISVAAAELASFQRLAKSLADELKQRQAMPPPKVTVARVPDPTPAPRDSQPIVFLCRYARVLHYPVAEMTEELQQGLAAAMGGSTADIKPADFDRIRRHFDEHDISRNGLRWRMSVVERLNQVTGDVSRELSATIEWTRLDLGETLTQIQQSDSAFSRLIDRRPDRYYGKLYVWGDSFAEYACARDLLDQKGIAAGWIACEESPDYRIVASNAVARAQISAAPITSRVARPGPALMFVPGGSGGGGSGASGGGAAAPRGTGSYAVMGSGPGVDKVD